MRRTIFNDEHQAFREVVRSFYAKEVVPNFSEWEREQHPPRSFWRATGELGLLGIQVPERYGGAGVDSFLFNAILTEESQAAGVALGSLRAHTDICLPYLLRYATDEQKQRWLPRCVTGEAVLAIAMSEPGAGSDLAGIATRAHRQNGYYVVNGAKTFISNGAIADLVITVVRTGSDAGRVVSRNGRGRDGLSLLVIENGMNGFARGRKLEKLGLRGQDLSELFFDDVHIPAENLLGDDGEAFGYLTSNLAQERLSIAINSQAAAAMALQRTLAYTKERQAFGQPIASFQNTKFELAACATEVEAGQALIDSALVAHDRRELSGADAAKVKLFCTELQGRVIDRCLQLHGGYGYMLEYPIARAYADARVSRIYGGSSEVMKIIVSKDLGL